MKTTRKQLGLAVIIAAIALSALLITGCNNDPSSDDPPYVLPEDRPVKDRWGKYVDPGSTATLNYSVAGDGVCTITVGGIPESRGDYRWKASANFSYTAKADASYMYTFEAWTQSDARDLNLQYYSDNDESIHLYSGVSITNTRRTYTVRGLHLPKGGERLLNFQCADQKGTFYVKILEIKEFNIGKLTITNFSGNLGLTQNSFIGGWNYGSGPELSFGSIGIAENEIDSIQIKGNTIILPVWEVNYDEVTFAAPFLGNITVASGDLRLKQMTFNDNWEWIGDDFFYNKVPIIFTNGNATINFGTQMEFD